MSKSSNNNTWSYYLSRLSPRQKITFAHFFRRLPHWPWSCPIMWRRYENLLDPWLCSSYVLKVMMVTKSLCFQGIPLLRRQCPATITLSQSQISCLLANAFFCTFPHRNATGSNTEYHNFPTINFSRWGSTACVRYLTANYPHHL